MSTTTLTQATSDLIPSSANGDLREVQRLLSIGADPNWPTPSDPQNVEQSRSALMAAAHGAHYDVVKVLLDAGANPNQGKTHNGASALFCALPHGQIDVTVLLLDRGANPNQATTDTGATPMFFAAQHGHVDLIRLLLERNADPNWDRSDDGSTALMRASLAGHVDVVRLLLEHNAKADHASSIDGSTALMWASLFGHYEVAKLVLDGGADPNRAKTTTGSAPLMMASQRGHLKVAQLLLERNALVDHARTNDETTALMFASGKGHVEVTRLLLDKGADPNRGRANKGSTALMSAAKRGHVEVTKLLLSRSASPNQCRIDSGRTPLMLAAVNNHLDVAQLLCAFGADINTSTIGFDATLTAERLARRKGNAEMTSWLESVSNWPPIRIAAGCRLHDSISLAMNLKCIDPFRCDPLSLLTTALASKDALWWGSKSPCRRTNALVRMLTGGWSPSTHHLYPKEFRTSVEQTFLTFQRLSAANSVRRSLRHDRLDRLPPLPQELWIEICKFFCPYDWCSEVSAKNAEGSEVEESSADEATVVIRQLFNHQPEAQEFEGFNNYLV